MSAERQRARSLKVFIAANKIRERVGVLKVEEAHMATLAGIAEMKGVWQCLLDHGMISEEERQNYLDRGVDALLEQVDSQASKIYCSAVETMGNG